MAEELKLTQEEEIIRILEKEGFTELSEEEARSEPYKSIYALPDCFEQVTEETKC